MSISFRPGTLDDNLAAYRVQRVSIMDLLHRQGLPDEGLPSEEEIQQGWEKNRSLYAYLTHSAEQFWVAEQAGQIVGYSRTVNHDGVRELTEFFVHPGIQAQGVGKELLERAFPRENARVRLVIATSELRAQALYMRSGVYARHAIYRFARPPQQTAVATDLVIEPVTDVEAALPLLAGLDRAIIDYRRDDDHRWLLADRQGWLYRRAGQVVGYGYTGAVSGPFALLEATDYPVVLAHAESQAATAGREEFAVWVHSINRHAVDYLLAQRFVAGRFFITLLSNDPFGRLDHYINTDPPLIL